MHFLSVMTFAAAILALSVGGDCASEFRKPEPLIVKAICGLRMFEHGIITTKKASKSILPECLFPY